MESGRRTAARNETERRVRRIWLNKEEKVKTELKEKKLIIS